MKLESEARAAGRCFEHLTQGMISGKLLGGKIRQFTVGSSQRFLSHR